MERTLLILLAVAALLSGCAQTRLLASAADERVLLDWKARAPGNVEVTLEQVIVRGSPGSWVRDADWDEYVLRVRNDGLDPVEIQAVELASDTVAVSVHTTDYEALEDRSRANIDRLKSLGTVVALGAGIVTGAVAVAAIETAAAYGAFMGGTGAGAAAVSIAPIVLIAGTAVAVHAHTKRKGERAAIVYEIERVGFHLPRRLPAGAEVRASAFFPITPAPNRLRVRYTTAGEAHEAVVETKPLYGLHLAKP